MGAFRRKVEYNYGRKKVLIVSPHPDDEVLGGGGTLLKLGETGYEICWLNITQMKEEYGYKKSDIRKKQESINKIKQELNIKKYFDLELRPGGLNEYSSMDIICRIGKIVDSIKPEIVIFPFYGDAHTDHKIVYDWCFPLSKSFRYPYIKQILVMEILSETNFGKNVFHPNYYVDISEYFDKKIRLLNYYEREMGTHPFPRSYESIEALAKLRGTYAGVFYAEAFEILKIVN